jgi:hypothetical protein
MKPMLRW